jgi:hypothetical protein
MFSGKALLVIGLALALWGRSLSHDDQVAVGLKSAGQIGLRSTAGAISLFASEGLLKLGKEWAWHSNFQKISSASSMHKGFHWAYQKPMSWEVRLPIFLIAVLAGLWLFLRARMTRS